MLFITNAFSIQMLPDPDNLVSIKTISADKAAEMIRQYKFESFIGHADTANVVSGILDANIEMNRKSVHMTSGDQLIVAQVMGGRLPEGTTTIPPGMRIEFKLVKILKPTADSIADYLS